MRRRCSLSPPKRPAFRFSFRNWRRTVVRSFIQAGALALISITIILFVALRRVSDVLLTLVPLLLAGVVTLELCVLMELPLNFANIIALPVLLGVGVAFKIYYVLAWRQGETSLLASPLTRAVIFSAMTTAVGIRQSVVLEPSGNVEHGRIAGAVARHDARRSRALPADPDGPAAASAKPG